VSASAVPFKGTAAEKAQNQKRSPPSYSFLCLSGLREETPVDEEKYSTPADWQFEWTLRRTPSVPFSSLGAGNLARAAESEVCHTRVNPFQASFCSRTQNRLPV
jgi:hypothetical protein